MLRGCGSPGRHRLLLDSAGVPSAPLLRTEDLSLTYPGGTTALDGLTIEVPTGSIGLVGANGADPIERPPGLSPGAPPAAAARAHLEEVGPAFEASKTGGPKTSPVDEDLSGRETA